jgi:hypothetical protein
MSDPDDDQYRPTSRRQRLAIIAVTVLTVTVLWMLLLLRPGAHVRQFPPSKDATCAKGQTSGCPGQQADVMLLAPSAGASGASTAP